MRKEFTSEDVRNMCADGLKWQKFRTQFMAMWQLDDGYNL